MQNAMPLIIGMLFIVVVIGAIVNAIAQRKQREGLFELAQRLNLNFDAGQDFGIPGRFGFLKLPSRRNLISAQGVQQLLPLHAFVPADRTDDAVQRVRGRGDGWEPTNAGATVLPFAK
jgi:hypothetical protein